MLRKLKIYRRLAVRLVPISVEPLDATRGFAALSAPLIRTAVTGGPY